MAAQPKFRLVKGGKKNGADDLLEKEGDGALDAIPDQDAMPPEGSTDVGNARRLVRLHGADLRYNDGLGWLVWDGKRWRRDIDGEVMRRAKDTARSINIEAGYEKDDARRQALNKWAAASESRARLEAMIELAKSEPGVYVGIDELDRDPWLLNVLNGTVDLRTGKLREPRREDLITKQALVEFDSKDKSPTHDRFLDRIFGGKKKLIGFVQRFAGYTLTGNTMEKALVFMHGAGGDNGKSTFIENFAGLMGDYAHKTQAEVFMAQQHPNRPGASPERIALRGARLVFASELDEGQRFNEALVKDVTGGIDRMSARDLYKGQVNFKPEFKPWFYGNHKPVIRGTDNAIWNRVHLIPFEVSIPKREQDRKLPEKLAAERSGILNWLIAGCLAWQKQGLAPPDEVQLATQAYRDEMDWLRQFLTECCVGGRSKAAPISDLYFAYTAWCSDTGIRHPETKPRFLMRLKERGFKTKVGSHNVKAIEGLELKDGHGPKF